MLIVWLRRFSTMGRQSCACKEFFAGGQATQSSPRSNRGGSERNNICNMQYIEKSSMSFQELLRRCYLFSPYRGYDFDMFEGVHRHCVMSQETLERPLGSQLFKDAGFVSARDLGCQHLGRSINEVLQTLICASEGTTFCPDMCGCAEEDLQIHTYIQSGPYIEPEEQGE